MQRDKYTTTLVWGNRWSIIAEMGNLFATVEEELDAGQRQAHSTRS